MDEQLSFEPTVEERLSAVEQMLAQLTRQVQEIEKRQPICDADLDI